MEDFISPSVDRKRYYAQMAYNKRHGIPCLRTCKICGKQFAINNSCRRYCSAECKAEAQRLRAASLLVQDGVTYTKKCSVCGKEFVTASPTKVYCSSKCAKKRGNDLRREQRRLAAGVDGDISCAYCHNVFTPVKLGQKFCSERCSGFFKYWHGDIHVREAKLGTGYQLGERTCAWCGQTFMAHRHNQKCCSEKCAVRFRNNHCSEAEHLAEKERKRQEREASRRSRRERQAVSTEGLTKAQIAEVVSAQDGDPAQLWQRSQKWTAKQHAFAKRRYCYIHGI